MDNNHKNGTTLKETKGEVMAKNEPSTKPFQLAIVCGEDTTQAQQIADTHTTIHTENSNELIEELKKTGLKTSDLRAKTLLIIGDDTPTALRLYATLTGFCGRYMDVSTPGGIVPGTIKHRAQKLPDAGKPQERKDTITISATEEPGDHQFKNGTLVHLTEQDISEIKAAKRVHFKADRDADAYTTFAQFLTLTGIRSRKGFDRLPIMDWGTTTEDLDDRRREGAEYKKDKPPYKTTTVEPHEPNERQKRLMEASEQPMEELLKALGSTWREPKEHEAKTMWQCPRPQSHTHGDATPSMQIQDNKVRCFVDDAEWIDPVRLVMESCGVTPNEAANLILTGESALAPFAQKIRQERERRASAT